MHNSSSSLIIQKYILLATGTPSSFAMRESIYTLYEQTGGQNQVAELIDTFMGNVAHNHSNGLNGVIQDIAYNGFGLNITDHAAEQLKYDLGSQGINSWSKLFAYAAIELEGELGTTLHNRGEAANLFTDLLAELNRDGDYTGSQAAFAAREWLVNIGSTDESFTTGTSAIRNLIDSFHSYRDYTPPELTFSLPLDGATDFQTDDFIIFEFNEPVKFDKGVVVISNGEDVRTINAQEDADLIRVEDNLIIIDPGADLEANSVYNISFEHGHSHGQGHEPGHSHGNGHAPGHSHGKGHKHGHGHRNKYKLKDKYKFKDKHDHDHNHDYDHDHDHDHDHRYDQNYKYEYRGIITDLAGNAYKGPTEFQFSTIQAVDPFLIDSIPHDEETAFQIDSNITLTFNELVAEGNGDIIISNSVDATDTRVIAVEDASQVLFDGRNVIINPAFDLLPDSAYNIQITDGAIVDLLGHTYAGISVPTALNFNTIFSDNSDPQLTSSNPIDDVTDFHIGSNIILSFDEAVAAGVGDIVIRNSANAADTRTISVADANQVTFDGSKVIINPTLDLLPNAEYNIQLASGVIVDLDGNAYAGISAPTILNFTATNTDSTAPFLISSNPADDATDFQFDSNITLSFDETVVAGFGNIIISNSVNVADTRTISVADANQITFDGSNVIINPMLDLLPNAEYNIQLASGVIVDQAGNAYAGISDPTVLNFTATNADVTNPQLTSSDPADDATDFQVDSNITLSFDETVTAGVGDIVIRNSVDAADTRTISIADANQITFNGGNVIVNPTLDLQPNAAYDIQLADGVVVDLVGNTYAGISDAVTLNFSTALAA